MKRPHFCLPFNFLPYFYTTLTQLTYLICLPKCIPPQYPKINNNFYIHSLSPLGPRNTCIQTEIQIQMTPHMDLLSQSYILHTHKVVVQRLLVYYKTEDKYICTFMCWSFLIFTWSYLSNILSRNAGEGPSYRKPGWRPLPIVFLWTHLF